MLGVSSRIVEDPDTAQLIVQTNPGVVVSWDFSNVTEDEAVVLLIGKDSYPYGPYTSFNHWLLLAAGQTIGIPLREMEDNYVLTCNMGIDQVHCAVVARITWTGAISPVVFQVKEMPLVFH